MKADEILEELYEVKTKLSRESRGDAGAFLDDLEAWLLAHPQPGSVVESPEAWATMRQSSIGHDSHLPPQKPYRIYDPIIAEIHRHRAKRSGERKGGSNAIAALKLREEPPEYREKKD
jgi:hypothetical protein